jgi:tetratricopeptide (TPR) repeat protein
MTKLISLAVHYNNKGAAFLEGENYKGAIVSFTKGLQSYKLAFTSCQQNGVNQSPEMNVSLDACMNLIVDSKDVKSAAYTSEDKQEETPYNMHMRPIRLPPMYLLNHVVTDYVLSTILIFNQALAHHLMGIQNNDSSSLKKAVKLYACGFNLIIQEGTWVSSTCYILACLNNMGLIFRCRNKIESAKKCFQQLLSTLMFLTHSNHQCSTDLDIYFQTAYYILLQGGASPAPAA